MYKLTFLTSLLLTVLLSTTCFAQSGQLADYGEVKINLAIKNYHKALKSENAGMTESAIINIMSLKYYHPNYDYGSIVQQLEELEKSGATKSIRFMSFIVKNYLVYPDRYAWIDDICCEKDKTFYAMIAEKVHAQVEPQ